MAVDLAPADREAYLRKAVDDPAVRAEVESLLRNDAAAGSFLKESGLPDNAEAVPFVEAPRPGERLGRYRLYEELGRGGMGVVFRADDPELGREVAIKVISPGPLSPSAIDRFRREARTLAQLDHPGILQIFDVGDFGNSLFIVMPLVDGNTLGTSIRQQRLQLGEVLEIGVQLADALDYSHARGVVHRDVKPGNIMLSRDRRGLRARLMDFGLAREGSASSLTQSGSLLGTLAYMSPEQVDKEVVDRRPLDGRADLYALGMVLYECLLGEPAFSGTVPVLLYSIVHEPPLSLRQRGVKISEDLDRLVLSCLAKNPARRPTSGGQLAESLRKVKEALADAERTVLMSRSARSRIRQPSSSPFVGREKELVELRARLHGALSGHCQLVLVEGDVGSGKSRLLEELERMAAGRGVRVLHGRFADRRNALPFQGFGELVQEYLRTREEESSPDLLEVADDLQKIFPALTVLFRGSSSEGSTGSGSALSPPDLSGTDPRSVFDLLTRTLALLADARPLAVLLESLHADAESVEALAYVVRRFSLSPTLFLGTFVPSEVGDGHPLLDLLEGFEGDPRFCRLTLEPLTATELRELVEIVLGASQVDDADVERIRRATEGNPFFTHELVRSLVENGDLKRDTSGTWRLRKESGVTRQALPETVLHVVRKRVKRLDEKTRTILETASILGRRFDYRDLKALVGRDIEEEVDRLIGDRLLVEDHNMRGERLSLSFRSAVFSDALYRGLPPLRRRKLHQKHAERLEDRSAGRLDGVYNDLVYHLSEAALYGKTVRYGRDLARLSLLGCRPDDALFAARRALVALRRLDKDGMEGTAAVRGELLLLAARAEALAGRLDEALNEAEEATGALAAAGAREEEAEATLFLAETAWKAWQDGKARHWVERGLELARGSGKHETLRALLDLGATLAYLRGEHQAAQLYREQAEALRPADDAARNVEAIPKGGTLVTALPNPVRHLDPAGLQTDEEAEVVAMLHETLLSTDGTGALQPQLGQAWKASDDSRSFEVELRPDLRFSDGSPLRALDVKRSFERIVRQRPTALPAALDALDGVSEVVAEAHGELRGIEVRDDLRLVFRLREPLPIFPSLLCQLSTAIVKTVAPGGRHQLLGTGPFVLEHRDEHGLYLRRNPSHWRGAPRLEKVALRTDLDASGIASGLRSGAVDLARDLLPTDLEDVLRDPRFRPGLAETIQKNVYFTLFNTSGSMAGNVWVRRALAGVLRVQELVWSGLGRFVQPAVSLIPPGILGHDPGRRLSAWSRDEARKAIQASGLRQPVELRAAIHPLLRDRCGFLLQEWAALGVQVVNVTPTSEAYLAAWDDNGDVDLMIGRWIAHYADPDSLTYALFHSSAGRLRSYYSSPQADHLMETARQEVRDDVRRELYRRLESLLAEESVVLPLFYDVNYRIANPGVRGLRLRNVTPYVNYETLGKSETAADRESARSRAGEEARWGGEVRVAISDTSETLDPATDRVGDQAEVIGNVFETLVIEEGARIVPWLAELFEVRRGGRELFLRLRPDVHFHDGRRLSARDVRYSFERNLRTDRQNAHFPLLPIRGARALCDGKASSLAGFRILSSHEIVLELEEPIAFFPALLASGSAAVVPEGSRFFTGSWRDGCVGTGPFRVVRCQSAGRIELERNPEYWRPGYPRSSRLLFDRELSPGDAAREFRAGRLTLVGSLPPVDLEAMCRTPELMAGYHEAARLATYFLAFNTHRDPFADAGLRHDFVDAFLFEIDRAVRETTGRSTLRATGFIPPGLPGYEAGESTPSAPSRGVFEAFSGMRLRTVAHPIYATRFSDLWNRLHRLWTDAGVRHERIPAGTIAMANATVREGTADLVVLCWVADYPDADGFVGTALHSAGGMLHKLCGHGALDRLIEKGRRETDPALRHTIYREIEETLAREALLVPLFHEKTYRFCRPEVEGLRLKLVPPEVRYDELFVKR